MPRFQLKQNGERPTYTRKDNMLIYGKTPKDYIKMIRDIDGYIKKTNKSKSSITGDFLFKKKDKKENSDTEDRPEVINKEALA